MFTTVTLVALRTRVVRGAGRLVPLYGSYLLISACCRDYWPVRDLAYRPGYRGLAVSHVHDGAVIEHSLR